MKGGEKNRRHQQRVSTPGEGGQNPSRASFLSEKDMRVIVLLKGKEAPA